MNNCTKSLFLFSLSIPLYTCLSLPLLLLLIELQCSIEEWHVVRLNCISAVVSNLGGVVSIRTEGDAAEERAREYEEQQLHWQCQEPLRKCIDSAPLPPLPVYNTICSTIWRRCTSTLTMLHIGMWMRCIRSTAQEEEDDKEDGWYDATVNRMKMQRKWERNCYEFLTLVGCVDSIPCA